MSKVIKGLKRIIIVGVGNSNLNEWPYWYEYTVLIKPFNAINLVEAWNNRYSMKTTDVVSSSSTSVVFSTGFRWPNLTITAKRLTRHEQSS